MSYIKKLGSLRKIILKKLQGKKLSATPKNLQVLVRPQEGFQKIYDTLHEILLSQGVEVKLNCNIESVRRKGKQFEIELADGKKIYDEVISTIPIPVISKLISQPLQKDLESMNLLTLFYRFRGDLKHNYSVLHNFTTEGAWKRITTFSKYYGKHEGDDYFSVEITLNKDSEPDVGQQQQQFEQHVKSLGLMEGELKFQGSLLTKNAYPVYLIDNVDEIIASKDKLKNWGLYLAGRQGEFNYLNSSDATGNAVRIAKEIKQRYQKEAQQFEAIEARRLQAL